VESWARPRSATRSYYDFSETIDAQSVIDGWDGTSTNVVVDIFQNGSSDDTITIRNAANTAQISLGSVDTNGDPVSGTVQFGASGTPSTMVKSGTRITITLGTASSTNVRTDNKTTPMVWTPSASISDLAGNAMTTTPVSEGGALDINF